MLVCPGAAAHRLDRGCRCLLEAAHALAGRTWSCGLTPRGDGHDAKSVGNVAASSRRLSPPRPEPPRPEPPRLRAPTRDGCGLGAEWRHAHLFCWSGLV